MRRGSPLFIILFNLLFFIIVASLNLPIPDIKKMNVSQEEYERMFRVYLRRVKQKYVPSSYFTKQFYAYKHSDDSDVTEHSTKLNFPTNLTAEARVESAILRMLVNAENEGDMEIYQRLSGRDEVLVDIQKLEKGFLPRWMEVRLERVEPSAPIQLRVTCPTCQLTLLAAPTLNLLVDEGPPRKKRENRYRTDCYGNGKRQRCCRHKMQVVFKDLPGYDFIIQPYSFDAGFCKGSCPYRYNLANHHASLQSLIWRQKKGAAPKPCCAPSKLDQLEIIQLDEKDPTKLKVATWSNMKVIECACF